MTLKVVYFQIRSTFCPSLLFCAVDYRVFQSSSHLCKLTCSKSCLAPPDLNLLNQQLHFHVFTLKNRCKSKLFEFYNAEQIANEDYQKCKWITINCWAHAHIFFFFLHHDRVQQAITTNLLRHLQGIYDWTQKLPSPSLKVKHDLMSNDLQLHKVTIVAYFYTAMKSLS